MSYILFLRHGQATNNTQQILVGRTPGVPLTDLGKKQAQMAAEFVEHLDVSAIYSSPIERAQNTADIVAKHNSLDYVTDSRLTELEMGLYTGMKYQDIYAKHGNVFVKFYQNSPDTVGKGVEPFEDVKQRVRDIVDDVVVRHPNQNVILVTHMDPIKAMISTLIDLTPQQLSDLIIANASLNIFKKIDNNSNNVSFALSAINLIHPSRFNGSW